MAVQSFSYEIALLLTKYTDAGPSLLKKTLKFFEKDIILV